MALVVDIKNDDDAARNKATLRDAKGHFVQLNAPLADVAAEQALPATDVRDMMVGHRVARHGAHQDALPTLRIWHHYQRSTTPPVTRLTN